MLKRGKDREHIIAMGKVRILDSLSCHCAGKEFTKRLGIALLVWSGVSWRREDHDKEQEQQ